MNFSLSTFPDIREIDTDVLVTGIYSSPSNNENNEATITELPSWLKPVDDAMQGQLLAALKRKMFSAKGGEIFSINPLSHMKAKTLVIVGMGDKTKIVTNCFRMLGAHAVNCANDAYASSLTISYPFGNEMYEDNHLRALVEGMELANYRFDKFFTEHKAKSHIKNVTVACISNFPSTAQQQITAAQALSKGVCLARDLVNESASDLTPPVLAMRAKEAALAHNLEVTILEEAELERERMGMMLAVGRASKSCAPPRLVRIAYRPSKPSNLHIALVGKGLTFDSGGLNMKSTGNIETMKTDMSGAATVLGTMIAIAQLKPNIAVTAFMGCVENGVGANAYHPGDVLISRKGLTVEINNTDAEGRLVLGDVIDYAQDKEKPDFLIDVATLTGACVVALGPHTAGLFSNDEALQNTIQSCGKEAGEDFWPMPLNDQLFEMLKSPIADMQNTGERYGGAITAALFLKKFIRKQTKWAHLDIAGPAHTTKAHNYIKKGGVGFGVRTLTETIIKMSH